VRAERSLYRGGGGGGGEQSLVRLVQYSTVQVASSLCSGEL
jgi:hypothetical protein